MAKNNLVLLDKYKLMRTPSATYLNEGKVVVISYQENQVMTLDGGTAKLD